MLQYQHEYLLPPRGPHNQHVVLSVDSTSQTFIHRDVPIEIGLKHFVDLADFLTQYSVRITIPPQSDLPANAPSCIDVHYFHKESGTRYVVRVRGQFRGARSPTVDLTNCMNMFDMGYAKVFEPTGRMLGESGRVDDKREFGANPREYLKKLVVLDCRDRLFSETSIRPIQPCTQRNGLGTLGRLPREVRFEIYRLGLSDPWQGYHVLWERLILLGTGQFSAFSPALLRTSHALAEEVRHQMPNTNRQHGIIVGKEVIAFNFVLESSLRPGDSVCAERVRMPPTNSLFIGVQVPSPRKDTDLALVQYNVKALVGLLNAITIGRHTRIPPIRVSFQTNKESRGCMYFQSDFETLMKPFGKLITIRNPGDSRKPLVIDRALPAGVDDGRRARLCDEIEASAAPWFGLAGAGNEPPNGRIVLPVEMTQ